MPFPISWYDLVLIKTLFHTLFDEDLHVTIFLHFVLFKLFNSKILFPVLLAIQTLLAFP